VQWRFFASDVGQWSKRLRLHDPGRVFWLSRSPYSPEENRDSPNGM